MLQSSVETDDRTSLPEFDAKISSRHCANGLEYIWKFRNLIVNVDMVAAGAK